MASDSRKEVRRIYSLDYDGREFDKGFEYAIETIFGKHNLTSDIEPEEILLVEKKRVNEIYSEAEMNNKYYSQPNCNERERKLKEYFGGQMVVLKQIFGDKCLNEKTLFSENHKNENKENGIVGSENKYGVKPKCVSVDEVCKILGVDKDGLFAGTFKNIMPFGTRSRICNGFKHEFMKDGDIVTVVNYNRDKDTYDALLNMINGETIPAKNLEPL